MRSSFRRVINDLKYYRTVAGFNTLSEIKTINIELCAVCNLKCKYCTLKLKPNRFYKGFNIDFIDIFTVQRFLDELKRNKIKAHINLSHSGEVLLHPNFRGIAKLVKNSGVAKTLNMNTNLMLMDSDMVSFIINNEIFDEIVVSIDGKNKEDLERIRKGVKADKVLHNLENLKVSISRWTLDGQLPKPIIIVNNGHDDISEIHAWDKTFKDFLEIYSNKVKTYKFHDWTGSIDVPFHKKKDKKGYCMFCFNTIVLFTNGDIGKCCSDLNAETVYGNIHRNDLKDIYLSKRRKAELKLFRHNRRKEIKGCETCTR